MKPQDFETTTEDPWIIVQERNNADLDIKLVYKIYDIDEAPTIQLSNSTISKIDPSCCFLRVSGHLFPELLFPSAHSHLHQTLPP
jgi:hypothetical protein